MIFCCHVGLQNYKFGLLNQNNIYFTFMIRIQPDTAIISSINILREKKQFVNKINFALSCILQSLRVTNPKYDDNMTHILSEHLYKDLALVLNNYEDQEISQQVLSILMKLISFNASVGIGIQETNLLKGIEKNIGNVIKSAELLVSLFDKISKCDIGPNWYIERDIILGKILTNKMSDENVNHVLKYIEEQSNIKIGKGDLFAALPFYTNKKIIKSILYQIYKRIDNKADRLSNVEMNHLLVLVDQYIGDCELCYIIYFILAKFYTFKQAVAANNEHKLIIAYVYALGEANMEFQPAFTDEKSFIYTLAILSEGDRFSECYIKVLMPKFEMIKSQAAELKFLSELKKIGLKQNIRQLYNPLKQTLSKSKHPKLVRQYEYLLKSLDHKHEISKSKDTITLEDATFKSEKQFSDYFISLLLLITLFEANLPLNETEKFIVQALRFIKTNRIIAIEYISFLYQFVVKIESQLYKNQNFQNLLNEVYIQCLQSEFKPNKITKLQEIIIRSFTPKLATLVKQRDSVKIGVIIPTLVVNPATFKIAVNKLSSFNIALRNGEFNINTKFYLLSKVLKSCQYTTQIEDVVIYFLESIIEVLEKEKDSKKIAVLEGIIKWIPKLQKNHIYVKLISNRTVSFLLERLFYILVSLIKNLQCNALFDIIFELEQWIPLQELLRKNQADKIISVALQNYSSHTADIIELMEVVFGEPDSQYYKKSSAILQTIHKNIKKNLHKYTIEDLAAYHVQLHSQIQRKNKFEIKNAKPSLKQLQQKCDEFKQFVFFHENPEQDPSIADIITITLKDIVQVSGGVKGKDDQTIDACAKSILVSLIWTYQNSENDIPVVIIEHLNTLLNSSFVSPLFVRKALQAIATLPHTFNLAKLPFEKLYEKYTDNVTIIEVLNDLIKIIAENSPKALNTFKFEAFINEILYFLVFENDSLLIEAKLKLLETICLVESAWNEFLLGKVFVLEKIIRADLSNPTFYRPKTIESILNMMDQLDLLKGLPFQLCKLFEKYIDQSQICYMILLNLKQLPAEQVTKNLNQRALAYILINSEDKDLLQMSKNLMAEYKDLQSNKQQEFVKAFAKKNYDKCEQLITQIEKPHEVEFIKNEVNAFLGSDQIADCPKVKEFIMTNKKAEPVLYECEAFYKDEVLLNDLVQKFEEIDNQLQVFSFAKDGSITSKKPSIDLNIQSIKQMLKKQNFIVKYVQTILAGKQAEQLPKVKLICLLSKIPQLTQLCDLPAVRKLLDIEIYQTLFYDSGLAYPLYHENQTNVLNLMNHLQSHLLRQDGSKTHQNEYMCKLLKQILNHKPKNKQYFIKLLEIVAASKKITNPNNIDILTNMSHEVLLLLHEHRKGLKFSSSKEQTYFNNLELILVQYYQSSMTFSDIHNVSLKTIDRLYSYCQTPFQYQLFVYILKKYLDNESKQKDREDVLQKFTALEQQVEKFSEMGKATYQQISNPVVQNNPKFNELLTKLQGEYASDIALKQQTIQTITHYSKYFDEVINSQAVKDKKKLNEIEQHLTSICNNTFYYNKMVKLRLVEKLITIYGLQPNNVVNLLLRLSYNKSVDILKSDVVVKFIKDRLKFVLQSKPNNSDELTKMMSLFANSQYTTFDAYFKSGLYSTIIEILKSKVMEKDVLNFINGFKMDEKLVNELYQRGLIQICIERIGTSPKDEGQEWITLLGKICINPAIQTKLLGIKIHEEIYKKLKDSQKSSMMQACAIFFANVGFNNDNAVKWMIDKKITKIYPADSANLTESAMVEIIKNIYSIGYNNAAGKKHLIETNVKGRLYNYYQFWIKGIKSNYLIPWNVCKTLSTLVLDPEFAEILASDKFLLLLTKQNIEINHDEQCFNPIEFLHNLLANINKPKLYQSLKSNKLHQFYKQIRNGEQFFSQKHVEMLVITTCLLARCQLLDTKDIDVEYFEFIFKVIIKHNISDQITETALTKFLECVKNSKDVRVTQSVLTSLEKIARNRKTDLFMPVIIQIIEYIRDLDLVRSIMSKGELPHIICNLFQTYSKDKQAQAQYMNSLVMMANSHWIADVIVGYIGRFLLESVDIMKLKVLDALSQYSSTAGFIIQLNGISILGDLLGKNPPNDQLFLILNIGKKLFRVKEANQSQKEMWLSVISKMKMDPKSAEVANQLKSIFNNKVTQLSPEVKQQLNKGILCTLYKTDGSASKLLLTITKSLNEINCIHEGSSTVKSKWRVPINDIKQIISYNDQAKFQKSHFYKSNFLGKKPQPDRCLSIIAQNNELHILFPSKQAKQKWVSELMIVQEYVSQMLLMLR